MSYLIISRRVNERIVIGEKIEILISDIRQDRNGELKVDIAIDAPNDLGIERRLTHMQERRKNGATTRHKLRQRNQ